MRVPLSRKGNTQVEFDSSTGTTIVRYYSTTIVVATPDTITLKTGGWCSASTKQRMNQASEQFLLGYKVYQRKFEWFVMYKGVLHKFKDGTLVLERSR